MSNLQQATTRSFVDLKKFAVETQSAKAVRAGLDCPFLSNRRILELPPGPVSVGAIALDAGCGAMPAHPADEFIIVSEGTLELKQGGLVLTLGPGNSAVLRRGAEYSWTASGPVSIIFMRYEKGQHVDGNIVPIKSRPELELSSAPSADLLLTPAPICRNFTDYRSTDGEFSCGTWDSTPYHRSAMFYRHYELMYLLEGSVTFVDEADRTGTFKQGDIFLVEQGARCSWESREHVTKVYAIYRPA
ncbi:cupin domain-containing protein [Ralstonia wenshanensis]|uniref:(S)-ureidoglycine aminohydrolase cupin domain-containing protein n=1 Tax=Ralstonia wenshanensis TaxID=2842456 RepID=A0AAD2B9L8_9RALS|nr:cupin domain-containing protein [Ralstonia wenshanensis]CAJ0707979.1 hypothetical protein LMG18091_05104 [Ralstonia wenshanensis]